MHRSPIVVERELLMHGAGSVSTDTLPHGVIVDAWLTLALSSSTARKSGAQPGFAVVDADRHLARTIGRLLAQAGCGSAGYVNATVVAVAVGRGNSVVITGDDIEAIAAGTPVTVIPPA